MVPEAIQDYLHRQHVPFLRHWHPRAVTAQLLAQALHVTGYRVAKSVIVRADGQLSICLLPAVGTLDLERVKQALGCREVRLATEEEFAGCFPECEVGAEPPFGRLYGLPVLWDESLSDAQDLLMRAGSHEESLEVSVADFLALESPRRASLTRTQEERPAPAREVHP